jgi:hypothetical protein
VSLVLRDSVAAQALLMAVAVAAVRVQSGHKASTQKMALEEVAMALLLRFRVCRLYMLVAAAEAVTQLALLAALVVVGMVAIMDLAPMALTVLVAAAAAALEESQKQAGQMGALASLLSGTQSNKGAI